MSALFGSAFVFFAGGVLVHWLFTRWITNTNFVRNGYGFLLAVAGAASPITLPMPLLSMAFFYLQLIILWNLYTIFFINLMNSVSLRMMIEIANSPTTALTTNELVSLYADEEALESRLRGLVATGLLRRENQYLTLTSRGQMLGALLAIIRKTFGIEFFG